ncbi:MAG: Sialidase protein [Candidatus Hydrogenedentes bacterium]|nr:Sialidase protein [Candidatus Hydrogenedentota bacterium]
MRQLFLSAAMLGVCLAGFSATPDDYAHFAQSTVASHEDGHEHRWPCMARLSDGRILVVWSRLDLATNEDAIVGRVSQDGGCNWAGDRVFIQFDGQVDADPSMVVSGDRIFVTCTTVPPGGNIRISATWCVRSDDNGKTWSEPYEIPMGHRYTCGKTHHGLRLRSGTLVMGYSWDAICEQGTTLTSEGDMDLRAGVLRSSDNGDTWTNGGDTDAEYEKVSGGAVSGTDEPALVELEDGSLYTLVRTGSAYLYEGRSDDEGQTWHSIQASGLHGSNAPAALNAFDIGERRGIFAVWDNALSRSPLCAAASFDGGRTWSRPKDIGFP